MTALPGSRALVLALGFWFLLAPNVALAAFVTIEEGPSETSLIQVATDLVGAIVFPRSTETATVTGFLTGNFINPTTGFRGQVTLLEPDGVTFSDLLTVVIDPIVLQDIVSNGATDGSACGGGVLDSITLDCQRVTVSFTSDASEGGPPVLEVALALVGPPPVITTVVETGGLQDLTAALGLPADSLTIQVRSDLESVAAPAPATLTLLVAGLVSLKLARRNRGTRR